MNKRLKICLLLMAIVFICFLFYYIEVVEHFMALYSHVSTIFNLLISIGLFYIGYQANKIAQGNYALAKNQSDLLKYKSNFNNFKLLYDNYDYVCKAFDIFVKEGTVTPEALRIISRARNDGKLYLPEEIADYLEKLRIE